MAEISDGNLNTANDMVKADCRDCEGCSACCRNMGNSLQLDPYDIWQLSTGLGKNFEEMLQSGWIELGVTDGMILPYLKTNQDAGAGDADVDDDVVIVFGVGLNLALGACRLPTPQSTSLQLHVSGLPSFGEMRDAVAERQVEGFRERLVKFIADPKGQAESLREEVKAVCWARGRQVEAHFTDGTTLTGEAIGLNEDASLILRTQDGTDHTVRTADVGVL